MRVGIGLLAVVLGFAALVAQTASAATAVGSVTPALSATDVTTCNGSSTVTLTLTGVEPPPTQRHLDVELVLDESGSISAGDFSRMKSGAATFANSLLAGGKNQLGIVQFSGDARVAFHPTSIAATAVNQVNNIYQRGGSTAIGLGLQLAQQELVNFGRPSVRRVIILETDGQNNVATGTFASTVNAIKAAGTLIFAVGIGPSIDQNELNFTASTIPGVQTTYFSPDYTQLAATLQTIAGTIEVPAATAVKYQVGAAPGWTISGATATAGSVGQASADGFSWQLPSLGAQTVTLTYTATHTGSTDGELPFQSTGALTWTDDGGAAQSASFAGETVKVSGCNHPPVANAGADKTVQLSGSRTAQVSLDASGSSDPDGDALQYSWSENGSSIGSGAAPTVPLGIGVHTITLTATDGQLSSTDDVVVTVVDPTPPVVTPSISGTLGSNGWYRSDATVSWSVVDPESDIQAAGCDPSTVSADTTGATFTCHAGSAGGQTEKSVTIKRDATAPTVTYAGNAGTYALTDTVAITCSAADATSGVTPTTCPGKSGPAYLFPGTTTLSYDATDAAGNVGHGSASFTVAVTSAGVCGLIDAWVSNGGVANSLCVKAKHGSAAAFANEARAQTGKRLTQRQADVLVGLVNRL